jgi:hypothetical protein
LPGKPPNNILDSKKTPRACQKLIIAIGKITASILFQSAMIIKPRGTRTAKIKRRKRINRGNLECIIVFNLIVF